MLDSREFIASLNKKELTLAILREVNDWANFVSRSSHYRINQMEEVAFYIAIDFMIEQAKYKEVASNSQDCWNTVDVDKYDDKDVVIAKPIKNI